MLPTLRAALFISLLLAAAVSDLKSRTIPYSVCIILALTGLIYFSPVRLWGLILAVPFFLASGFQRGGAGDTMLVAASCLTLGLFSGALGLMLGLSVFCLYWLAEAFVRKLRQKEKKVSYPLAPFLAAGFIAAYFI